MRRTLLNEFNLEIGAGLGPLAGKIWRFGLMGYSCRPDNVMLCLSALGSVLNDMGLPVHVGDLDALDRPGTRAQRERGAGVVGVQMGPRELAVGDDGRCGEILERVVGRAERAGAQYPVVGVLSCSDSRVSPELLFEQGPGDTFVVRVAGNFVNQDGLASMEYVVKILGVPLLMVLGHTNCGAISAAVKVVTEHAELPGKVLHMVRHAADLGEMRAAADAS